MQKLPLSLHRNPSWLAKQYLVNKKSLREIAEMTEVPFRTIKRWLDKFGIPLRSQSESRSVKYWAEVGPANPMWGKLGALNSNWKGGLATERDTFYSTQKWKKTRAKVWKRDNATCQRCNKKREHKTNKRNNFHIHHIKSFAIKHLRAKLSNLVLLCKKCHEFVHSKKNKNRDFLKGTVKYTNKKKNLNTLP